MTDVSDINKRFNSDELGKSVKDIIPLLEDSSELVRAMAVWALRELSTKHDFEIQKNIYFSSEPDIEVKNEWLELENQICVPN